LSPILVRPVREQLEHDRVIRLLKAKHKRKSEVSINPGHERVAPVVVRGSEWYPDLVVHSLDARPRLLGTVEVETAESVNHLEAMSQWAMFSRLRAPFHLYIPVSSVDSARRLCASLKISVSEIWAYNALGDEILFTLVHRLPARKSSGGRVSKAAKPVRRTVSKRAAPSGTSLRRTALRKTTGKKRVVRTPALRKVARVAKDVAKRAARKIAKSTRATGAAKSARPARTAQKASKSSRPKKR
jgi:hypothetical protein